METPLTHLLKLIEREYCNEITVSEREGRPLEVSFTVDYTTIHFRSQGDMWKIRAIRGKKNSSTLAAPKLRSGKIMQAVALAAGQLL